MWRVKLVAEVGPGVTTETELACIERNEQASLAELGLTLAAAGVEANTPATVLCDGDAGLRRLQRQVLPNATPVLDWWRAT